MQRTQKGFIFIPILGEIVFLIALSVTAYLFVAQPFKVSGRSMSPTLPDGQYFLADKFSYLTNSPQRGDIVVYKNPTNTAMDFIGRIVGLPGEKVKVENGKVYINGQILSEPYLEAEVVTLGVRFLQEGQEKTIPAGDFVMLGDNRTRASDSRDWGFVPRENIVGKFWLKYGSPEQSP